MMTQVLLGLQNLILSLQNFKWYVCRYKVQWDVLKQLEQKVRELLQAQRAKTNTTDETTKQTLLKLERDFNRVQEVALSTNSKIQKAQKQWQQRGSVAQSMSRSNSSGASVLHQEQERIQAQLQQDVRWYG